MRPYLEELIRDMQESERKACRKRREGGLTKGEDSSRIEPMFLSHEDLYSNPRKLEDIVGIPQAAFPPAHLLSLREKATLASSMQGLLNSWNFYPDFPDKLPWHMRYMHLRALWKSEQVYTGMGVNYIDVCDFNANKCPFPNHCTMCNKIREQEKLYNKLMQKSNNPYRKK